LQKQKVLVESPRVILSEVTGSRADYSVTSHLERRTEEKN